MGSEAPWEAELLATYCKTAHSIDDLSYAKQSILACAWFIAKSSKEASKLCGETPIQHANVRQWLYYYATKVRTESRWDTLSRDQLRCVFQELNRVLSSKVFLVDNHVTLADIIMFYGLHRYMLAMSFSQKAEFIHISRWFDQIQHSPGVKPVSWTEVVFHKAPELLKY